ncbi:MAG: sulfotransferase [Pirellulales bacterium]
MPDSITQKLIRRAKLTPYLFFQRHIVSQLEKFSSNDEGVLQSHPPIFIIGPPRSGSTLAIQTIINAFEISYFTNRQCLWFGAPYIVSPPTVISSDVSRVSTTSVYGETESATDPSECGEWWYRFFRRMPPYVKQEDVTVDRMTAFRRSIQLLTKTSGRSIVFKNMYASLRIRAIRDILPEARFIIIDRDLISIAHSILKTREALFGTPNKWWSLVPPCTFNLHELPAYKQAVEQARQTYFTIDRDLKATSSPTTSVFRLSYEILCDSPQKVLQDLETFFLTNGITASRRSFKVKPVQRRGQATYPAEIHEQIKSYAAEIRDASRLAH